MRVKAKIAGNFLQLIEIIESCIDELYKGSARKKVIVYNKYVITIKKVSRSLWFFPKPIDIDEDDQLIALSHSLDEDDQKIRVKKKQMKFFITKATT